MARVLHVSRSESVGGQTCFGVAGRHSQKNSNTEYHPFEIGDYGNINHRLPKDYPQRCKNWWYET